MVLIIGAIVNIKIDFSPKKEEVKMFPDILGDSVLKTNDTGINFIRDIAVYDDFRENIIQGYKANYTGANGTMIIFIAQTLNNESANTSVKEMAVRNGYDPDMDKNSTNMTNWNVIMLPINNPEVYVIRKDINYTWHYTFAKSDKVYWVGFSNPNIEYQVYMLIEVYRNVAEKIPVGI